MAEENNALLKIEFADDVLDSSAASLDSTAVEFEFITIDKFTDERRQKIAQGINDIDERLSVIDQEVSALNTEIDRLTNHADGLDYIIAVSSGIVTGLLDAFFVGEWDFKTAKGISNKDINDLVMSRAKAEGYSGDRLDGAIAKLEDKFQLPGDNDWKGSGIGVSASSHHLDDFSHHPTPVGLICAILSQFTEHAFYSNKDGAFFSIPITVNNRNKFVGKTIPAKLFCGVVNWCLAVAGTCSNWQGHLMSDIAGSYSTAGAGMGIPGPIMSTLKEISSLPIIRDSDLPTKLYNAYTSGIGTGNGQLDLGAFNALFDGASSKMDIRTGNAVMHEIGRQALPVLINEALVRGFYFIRRLFMELKLGKSLENIDWKKVLPFRNRTIVRMLTISSGTFMAVDLADAGIRAVIKSGANPYVALQQFILRVNFVGVGRFAIAVFTDIGMGIKKCRKENERSVLLTERLSLSNAKLYYKNADMMCSFANLYQSESKMHHNEAELWIEVQSVEESMNYLKVIEENMKKYFKNITDSNTEIYCRIGQISTESIEQYNPGLLDDIFRR